MTEEIAGVEHAVAIAVERRGSRDFADVEYPVIVAIYRRIPANFKQIGDAIGVAILRTSDARRIVGRKETRLARVEESIRVAVE